jgi:MFS family permease
MVGGDHPVSIGGVKKTTAFGVFIVFLGAFFYFYEYFLRISPSVMKSEFMSTFHLGAAGFGTLSDFYFYAYTPMQLVVGIFIDRFPIRRTLVIAVLMCTAGSLLISVSDVFWMAALGRVLQGLGSAFAFVSALKLAAMWLPVSHFAFIAGSCAALGFLGAGLGEIVLSHTVKVFGWRHSIMSFTIIGVVLAILFWLFLGAKPKTSVKKSKKQILTLSWSDAFIQLLEIIKSRYIWWAGIISFLMFLPTTVFAALWGIPYLEKMHHYTPEKAAVASGLIFIGWAIGSPIQGWLSDLLHRRLRLIWLNSLASCILALCVLYIISLPYWLVCLLFVLMGITSSAQMLTFTMARDAFGIRVIGMAVAFVNTLAMLGGMIFQSGFGLLLDAFWKGGYDKAGEKIYELVTYEKAVLVVPICFILSAVIAVFVRDRAKLEN